MLVPSNFYNESYINCRLQAFMYKRGGSLPSDKIAEISAQWSKQEKIPLIVLFHNLTGNWALGKAELRILMTTPEGHKTFSNTSFYNIVQGLIK